MLIVAVILSLIFGAIGFIVTKSNAQYILSGYNTMSEQDRQSVDIDSYLRFFKQFHIVLALSLLGGVLLLSLVNNNWASIFMTVYPLVAYSYFSVRGMSFYKKSTRLMKVGIYLSVGLLVTIAAVLLISSYTDYKSSELTMDGQKLEIASPYGISLSGFYGISLSKEQIYRQKLVDKLPPIVYKSNGFAAGDYAKGHFKTKSGETILLFVNKKSSPFLLIESEKGDIYYNHDELDMQVLSQKLAQWLSTKL